MLVDLDVTATGLSPLVLFSTSWATARRLFARRDTRRHTHVRAHQQTAYTRAVKDLRATAYPGEGYRCPAVRGCVHKMSARTVALVAACVYLPIYGLLMQSVPRKSGLGFVSRLRVHYAITEWSFWMEW